MNAPRRGSWRMSRDPYTKGTIPGSCHRNGTHLLYCHNAIIDRLRVLYKMTRDESGENPLALLVLLMVCLSIGGSALAGAAYVYLDFPIEGKTTHPPVNIQDGSGKSFEPNPEWTGTISIPYPGLL